MPVLHHALRDLRGRLQEMSYHEEGGGGIVLFERIQDGLRVPVLVAAVKGQIDHLLIPLSTVVGIIPRQLRRRGIARGLLSLRAEPQAPILGLCQQAPRGLSGLGTDFRHLPAQEKHSGEQGHSGNHLFPLDSLGLQQLLYHILYINRLHLSGFLSQLAMQKSPAAVPPRIPHG